MSEHDSDFLGARFYKTDLHVHTPASKCWKGKRTEGEIERIFQKLKGERIEVVAITDHNSAESIDKGKKLGKQYGISVFPGVEVSTKEGHVLAIFDPRKSRRDIEDWLAKMGFSGSRLGDLEAIAEDHDKTPLGIDKVFALIENSDGIAIAPHPNSKNAGFLEVMKPKGVARQMAYANPCLRGLEVGEDREKVLRFASGRTPGYSKKYGCVATSDAHSVDEIGKSFTYIKMGDFSISALKQVFYDPAMRIRFADAWPPQPHAWIRQIDVSQGFFKEVSFHLHPDMNCFVGGKAVGKSLLIELMKFALGVESPIEEATRNSLAMMRAKTCLGEGGTVTLHVVSEDGERYRIQRTLSDLDSGPEVYYDGSEAKAASNVADLFQCKIYSQNEVIELGKTLPALLDWLDGFIDLKEEHENIDETRRQIKLLLKKLDRFHNTAKEIPAIKEEKEELEGKRAHLEKTVEKPILKTFPKWLKEQRELRKMQKGLLKIREQIIEPVKKAKVEKFIPRPEKNTPNYEDIVSQRESLIQLGLEFQELGNLLEQAVKGKEKSFEKYIVDWRKKFEKARKKHEELIKTAGVKNASALASELDKVTEAIETIEAKFQQAEDARKHKSAIERELRGRLIPEYSRMFAEVFKKRVAKATVITESLKSFVRIQVQQMSDRSDFEEEVQKLAKGSRLSVAQLHEISQKVTPVELARLILDRNSEELCKRTGVKKERIVVFIETAWAKNTTADDIEKPSQLYKMMLTELRDSVNVELHVGGEVYKPMNELSVGSKCTAILSVALVEGHWPLIVDQPEDALDNPFVFDEIVKTVRRSKAGRQYIFATHNPNVAVSADADLIFCLKATAHEGGVDRQGSIDEMSTKDRVVANLEGGKSAFRLRSQKYDIVVADPSAVVLDTAILQKL